MKRRKNPRLKNGFGSIRYLGKGRTRPYAVFAPSSTTNNRGQYRYDKPIAYAKTWQDGFCLLVAYNSGNFKPGMVIDSAISQKITNEVVEQVLSVFAPNMASGGATFKDVYEKYYDNKFNQAQREYSKSSIQAVKTGFRHCKPIHDKPIRELKHQDLQNIINELNLGHASKEFTLLTIKQTFQYALAFEYIDKNPSALVKIRTADDDKKRTPFTMEELKILYRYIDNPMAKSILFMCLTGFRINEYKTLEIDWKENILRGGSKTKAGKNRIVPIHPLIKTFIPELLETKGSILYKCSSEESRTRFQSFLSDIGLPKHVPHETRHTFSYLCDKFGVGEVAKKRMLGHSFQDITNGVYGHTDYDILNNEILKIPCDFLDF